MTRFQSVLVVLLITFFTHVASQGEEEAPIDKKKAGNPEIYDGLIAGVGPGTFAILFASFIGFLMCLLKNGSSNPRLMVVLAVLLPVFVFLVVKSLPVKSLSSEQVQNEDLPEDAYLLRSAFILGFIVLTFIAMSFCVFFSSISTQLIGQRIHSQSLAEFNKSQSQLELVKKQAADEEMDQSMQNDQSGYNSPGRNGSVTENQQLLDNSNNVILQGNQPGLQVRADVESARNQPNLINDQSMNNPFEF